MPAFLMGVCVQYQVITSQQALDAFVAKIKNQPVLALDTEFMRRRTLYPEMALIQVFDGQHIALIDPLVELDLSDFWALLNDPAILKVLHSPSEDIEVFQRYAQTVPSPLFDTQFAMQLLGMGNCVGFANMVKDFLDVEVDKSESRTNWLQRPLTERQLDYAAADVYYLLPCYQRLVDEVKAKGLYDIVLAESELVVRKRAFSPPDEWLYRDVKNAWQLKSRDLAVLKELAGWRRTKARQKNLALSFILKEHNMVEIAKRRPGSLSSLRNIPGIEPMEVNKSGKEILACVERGKAVPENELPEPLKRLIDFPGYKKAAKEIKQAIDRSAKANGIPADVMASKKQINQLIGWHWKLTGDERALFPEPDLLSSWRFTYLAKALGDWAGIRDQ